MRHLYRGEMLVEGEEDEEQRLLLTFSLCSSSSCSSSSFFHVLSLTLFSLLSSSSDRERWSESLPHNITKRERERERKQTTWNHHHRREQKKKRRQAMKVEEESETKKKIEAKRASVTHILLPQRRTGKEQVQHPCTDKQRVTTKMTEERNKATDDKWSGEEHMDHPLFWLPFLSPPVRLLVRLPFSLLSPTHTHT